MIITVGSLENIDYDRFIAKLTDRGLVIDDVSQIVPLLGKSISGNGGPLGCIMWDTVYLTDGATDNDKVLQKEIKNAYEAARK